MEEPMAALVPSVLILLVVGVMWFRQWRGDEPPSDPPAGKPW